VFRNLRLFLLKFNTLLINSLYEQNAWKNLFNQFNLKVRQKRFILLNFIQSRFWNFDLHNCAIS
jgi:hypothetical protein